MSLMTQRNMTLWDSNEMNRVKRIFKGTDGDESSVVSSSDRLIRSLITEAHLVLFLYEYYMYI